MIRFACAIVAVAITASALSMSAMSASAATPVSVDSCSSHVVEQTAAHLLNTDEVQQQIDKARFTGADVYVRTFQTVPAGGFNSYWQSRLATCATWRSATNATQPARNIVLIAAAANGENAVFYGPYYSAVIGDNLKQLQTGLTVEARQGNLSRAIFDTVQSVRLEAASANPVPPVGHVVRWTVPGEQHPTLWAVIEKPLVFVAVMFAIFVAMVLVLRYHYRAKK